MHPPKETNLECFLERITAHSRLRLWGKVEMRTVVVHYLAQCQYIKTYLKK